MMMTMMVNEGNEKMFSESFFLILFGEFSNKIFSKNDEKKPTLAVENPMN